MLTKNTINNEFFNLYFDFVCLDKNKEIHTTCHRWCALSLLATILGRQISLPFGMFQLLPNLYVQLIGPSASRKSTSIKMATKLLGMYGYTNMAAEKSSMEQFLIDLHNLTWRDFSEIEDKQEDSLESISFEDFIASNEKPKVKLKNLSHEQKKVIAADLNIAECLIASDEFVDFIGRSNLGFISLLGTFWDYTGVYDYRLKHSPPVYIKDPTINILSGNTHVGFNKAFPVDIQDQGFFSRLLMINVVATGERVPIPIEPSSETVSELLGYMAKISKYCKGNFSWKPEALALYEEIYSSWQPLEDPRLESYNGRRGTHLLKLTSLITASNIRKEIHPEDLIMANTILSLAEAGMPDALGEFGKSKNSALTQKILTIIRNSTKVITPETLLKDIVSDMENISTVHQVFNNLVKTNKIKITPEGLFPGPPPAWITSANRAYINPDILTFEERELR